MEYISKNIKRFFRFISEENKKYIEEYYLSSITRDYKNYDSNIENQFYTNEELEIIKRYSGYNYKHINNALRDTWNYEENGKLNKDDFLDEGRKLSEIITKKPTNLGNIKTYRGVNISYFREYRNDNGITSNNRCAFIIC